MNKLLVVPGTGKMASFNVEEYPLSCPTLGRRVTVWDLDGNYKGLFMSQAGGSCGVILRAVLDVHGASLIVDNSHDHVYWAYGKTPYVESAGPVAEKEGPAPDLILKLEISPKGLNVVHAEELISPDDVKPGDKIQMFDAWWNVRYINYYAGSKRFQLQREEDELHPLCDKTCMKVEIHDGLHVRIKRLYRKGGRV